MAKVVCAWCGKQLAQAATTALDSHGICAACAGVTGVFPTEELLSMTPDEFERLPVGVMEIDEVGTLRSYNRAEECLSGFDRSRFLGKNFFTGVAPCTQVREFKGRYEEMVARGITREEEFAFVFRFARGERLVTIQLIYDADRHRGLIVVKALG